MVSSIEDLARRREELETELADVKMQIAAQHGSVDHSDTLAKPGQPPADQRQAELSEEARKQNEAAAEKNRDKFDADGNPAPADPAPAVREARRSDADTNTATSRVTGKK